MKFLIFCFLASVAHGILDNDSHTFEFTTPTGLLTSPNYPNSNPGPMVWSYKITQPPGYIINLSISDINLGWNETDPSSTDIVIIFDGDREIFNRIDILSGSQYFFPSRTYNSTANHILVQYKTFSNAGKYRGFHATYQAINMGCGGIIRQNDSVLEDRSVLPGVEDCNWIIEAPPAHIIHLNVTHLKTYPTDFLTLGEWKDSRFNVIGHYSGSAVPKPLVSTGPLLYVSFKRANTIPDGYFSMKYHFVDVSNFSEDESENIKDSIRDCPICD